MAGIYIHIPFCKSRCAYCDFHSGTDTTLIERYVKALRLEMKRRADYLKGEKVKTIYFGGGTPSLLPISLLEKTFLELDAVFGLGQCREITLECNPDDLNENYVSTLKQLPINRLSIGIQSFSDNELQSVCRRHSAIQAEKAVLLCKKNGFQNISIDLIMGLPHQTKSSFENSLRKAISLDLQHISAYGLTFEEGTPLWKQQQAGSVTPMSDELAQILFESTMFHLNENGFEHYEISNYAKPGFRSEHNSSYWNGTHYIGLGSGAHSYNGESRQWNMADTQKYCQGMETRENVSEREVLTEQEHYDEYIMISLRTSEGIDLKRLAERDRMHCLKSARVFLEKGLLKQETDHLRLTRKGLFLSDAIIRDLMY